MKPQREAVRAEAERRARAGESLAEISRSLVIPLSTLNYWALKGGWRIRDLLALKREEVARLIEEQTADLRREADEAERQRREDISARVGAAHIEAARSGAAGNGPAVAGSRGPVGAGQRSLAVAQALLERGDYAEAERAARAARSIIDAANRMEAYSQRTKGADVPAQPAADDTYVEDEDEKELRMRVLRRLEEVAIDMNSEDEATARHATRALEAFVDGMEQGIAELDAAAAAEGQQA
jgi:hypothetical protein